MSATLGYFGIRHHGPGCARSLRKALDALRPDCVLIEGPAGAEAMVEHLRDARLQPPVALLSYGVDDPHQRQHRHATGLAAGAGRGCSDDRVQP